MKNIFKNAKLFNLYLNFSKLNSLVILIVARKNSSLSVINEKYFFMMFLYKEKTYNLIYYQKYIYYLLILRLNKIHIIIYFMSKLKLLCNIIYEKIKCN